MKGQYINVATRMKSGKEIRLELEVERCKDLFQYTVDNLTVQKEELTKENRKLREYVGFLESLVRR